MRLDVGVWGRGQGGGALWPLAKLAGWVFVVAEGGGREAALHLVTTKCVFIRLTS